MKAIQHILISTFMLFTLCLNTVSAQCNFFLPDYSNFNLVGTAQPLAGGLFQLTNNTPWQSGAAWYRDSADLSYDFDVSFNVYQFGGADGMVFVLQSCNNGVIALGGTGSDLAYYNSVSAFNHSLGVELDMYNSGAAYYDSDDSHIAIVKNASALPLTGPVNITPPLASGSEKPLRLTWNAASHVFSVYYNGVLRTSYTDDLVSDVFAGNPHVYLGFTAATGGAVSFNSFRVNYLNYYPSHQHTTTLATSYTFQCNSGTLTTTPGASSYLWSTGSTTNTTTVTSSGTYTVTATDPAGCTQTASSMVSLMGDPTVFGDHVWNVYVWNAGDSTGTSGAWTNNYSGYYVEPNLNFNTADRWLPGLSPSWITAYHGCGISSDNFSWSAKRQGFDCGNYQINIPIHDDAAQLFVNGIKVWEHIGCCDSHTNAWSGYLDSTSTVEFRVSEGTGSCLGQIEVIPFDSIILNGPQKICPGYSLQLSAGVSESYLWSTGETTQSITVNSAGTYSVTVTANGCTKTGSQSITVAPMDTPAIFSYYNFEYCPVNGYADLQINSDPGYSSITWSTGEPYEAIGVNSGGNYSVTVSDVFGCSATSHAIVTGPPEADSTFGNNVWKVNAYWEGDQSDYGYSWLPQDYSGYYTDTSLNFNSQNMWNQFTTPSAATNYQGCSIANDYISWSAKRQGFSCGVYQVDVLNHNDEAELFVDGVMVWYHDGCCDSHTNVWTGALNSSSKVEFKVTEGYNETNGALQFTPVNSTSTFITVTGNQFMCTGQAYTLTSIQGASYAWSDGETINPIHASQSGNYSVTVTDANGCSLTSDPVNVTILPTTAPVAHITASSNTICDWNPVTLSSDSISGNQWSTTETSKNISVSTMGDYSLTVTNNAGCSDQSTIHIGKGFTPPTPSVSNSGPACQNSSVNLTAGGLAPGGQAASFNGYTQYINVHQDIPESNFTIEMWVKTTEENTGFFSANNSTGTSDRFFYLGSGQLWVGISGTYDWNTGFTLNDGKWHHVALVVQTGVGQIVYVDGVSSGVQNSFDHSTFTGQTDFTIGDFPYLYNPYFKGQIDNVRIWSEARTQSEIRDNMLLETPSSTTNLVYEAALNGNVNVFIGTNGTTPGGISYVTPDYFTYSWTGTGAPAPSSNETQTISSIGASGTYNVTVTAGGCSGSPIASTDVSVIPLVNYYVDADGDGYGSATATAISSCTNPGAGYVINNSDCDDANLNINPGAIDVCNNVDDNCNGVIDENKVVAVITPGGIFNGCKGTPVTLTANSGQGIHYTWYKNGKLINGATTGSYAIKKSGDYYVYETNLNCSSTSPSTSVTINPLPASVISYESLNLCETGSITLTVNSGSGYSYQWKKGANEIAGATNQSYTTINKGTYKVVVTTSAGCSKTSAGAKVIKTCKTGNEINGDQVAEVDLNVYPNPTSGVFVIDLNLGHDADGQATIHIYNSIGQLIQQEKTAMYDGVISQEIHLAPNVTDGLYLVEIATGDQVFVKQLSLIK